MDLGVVVFLSAQLWLLRFIVVSLYVQSYDDALVSFHSKSLSVSLIITEKESREKHYTCISSVLFGLNLIVKKSVLIHIIYDETNSRHFQSKFHFHVDKYSDIIGSEMIRLNSEKVG